MSELTHEIARLSGGDSRQVDEIFGYLRCLDLERGDFLMKAGQICRDYYFVDSGAVRLYYLHDEQDYTVWIGTAGQIFTDLESYLEQAPTRIYMEAIEPSRVYLMEKETSDQLALTSNAYNTLLRKTVEIAFVNLAKNVISFQSQDAAARYQRVEKEKNWLAKYPLKYISSFIGVTKSSLSRLRAKRV